MGINSQIEPHPLQGWLRGARPSTSQPSAVQTIAIVASYDTFGAAPGLSFGAGSSGTAVVALLELARLFSKLYASGATHGGYNLLFLLTGGGPYDYDGTKQVSSMLGRSEGAGTNPFSASV